MRYVAIICIWIVALGVICLGGYYEMHAQLGPSEHGVVMLFAIIIGTAGALLGTRALLGFKDSL